MSIVLVLSRVKRDPIMHLRIVIGHLRVVMGGLLEGVRRGFEWG